MKKETIKNQEPGTSTFRLRLAYDNYSIIHTHDFWEFMLVTNGSFNHFINNKNIKIEKNVLCLIRPEDEHSIEKLSENASRINFIVPDKTMSAQIDIIVHNEDCEKIIGPQPIYFEVSERAVQNYLEIVSRINLLDSGSVQWHYTTTQMFFMFIQDLIKYMSKQNIKPHESIPKKVKGIIDSINFATESSKTLAEIIENSNYSYVHASRLFKKYMNMTLKEYHKKAKMQAATRLLEDPSLSIIQVAEKLGYMSLSHFNTVFYEHFSISPSKYRNYWTEYYSSLEDA